MKKEESKLVFFILILIFIIIFSIIVLAKNNNTITKKLRYNAWTSTTGGTLNSVTDYIRLDTEPNGNIALLKFNISDLKNLKIKKTKIRLFTYIQLVPQNTKSTLEVREIVEDWNESVINFGGLPLINNTVLYETTIRSTKPNTKAATIVIPAYIIEKWVNGQNYGLQLKVVVKNPDDSPANFAVHSKHSKKKDRSPLLLLNITE